ncbi:MAG: MFS transporter, partial [Bacteroidetes bacterium]
TSAYFMDEGMLVQFYILGVFVGMMMGAIQSMSRSTYAKFIPMETKDHASYFSFFETVEKFSISIGALVYALINQITKTQQASALALAFFFVIGFLLIRKIILK